MSCACCATTETCGAFAVKGVLLLGVILICAVLIIASQGLVEEPNTLTPTDDTFGQPRMGSYGLGCLLLVFCAIGYAFVFVYTRKLQHIHFSVVLSYFGTFQALATIVTILLSMLFFGTPFYMATYSAAAWGMALAVSFTNIVGMTS